MSLLHIAGGATEDKLYPEDVFATHLYTGNGGSQNINNGIDLAGKGGLVWFKQRTKVDNHVLYDTARGNTQKIFSNSTAGQITETSPPSFTSTGFSLVSGNGEINGNSVGMTSWTFRKAPKFFDVVTYTGNGVAGRQIPHNLGCEIGMIIVKCTSYTYNWIVGHRGLAFGNDLRLNLTDSTNSDWGIGTPSTTTFSVTNDPYTNQLGQTYVAYLFAHDPSADGIIQCGSFTDSGSGATVALGWEPQYILYKRTNTTGDWVVHDSMRGFSVGSTTQAQLYPNLATAETAGGAIPSTSATGVTIAAGGGTFIYLAIRRPNKIPTSGTEVFATDNTPSSPAPTYSSGFAVDFGIFKSNTVGSQWYSSSRLTQGKVLGLNLTNAESSNTDYTFDYSNGWFKTNYASGYMSWMFKRAKGFFDVVCWTQTVSGSPFQCQSVTHGLGVIPEIIIHKSRSGAGDNWYVTGDAVGTGLRLLLNSTTIKSVSGASGHLAPTSSTVFLPCEQAAGNTYVAYLFASCPGVSKVGSYIGNGTSQTINCGFSTGARFVLIKRTDSTGDWYIWDTARGIVAANDPHLSLNTTAAEVTTNDSIDPEASGFIVNQNTVTNINVLNGTYVYLAIA